MAMEQVMTHMKMKAKQFEGLIENLKTELETLRVQYIEMTKDWAIKDFNRLLKMKRKVLKLDEYRAIASDVYYNNPVNLRIIKQNGREYDLSGMTTTRNHRDYNAYMIDMAVELGIITMNDLEFWDRDCMKDGQSGMVQIDSFDLNRNQIKEVMDKIQAYRDESNGYQGRTLKHKHLRGSLSSINDILDMVNGIHIKKAVANAEKHFESSLEKLAIRLFDKNLDFGNLSFDTSHIDANISTTISDGDKSVRAWTIIASGEVQRPHYRYLIK